MPVTFIAALIDQGPSRYLLINNSTGPISKGARAVLEVVRERLPRSEGGS